MTMSVHCLWSLDKSDTSRSVGILTRGAHFDAFHDAFWHGSNNLRAITKSLSNSESNWRVTVPHRKSRSIEFGFVLSQNNRREAARVCQSNRLPWRDR